MGGVSSGLPVLCWFEDCRRDSVPLVGGKCASLGELINAGVRVPPGFALTTEGYRRFMARSGLERALRTALAGLDARDLGALEKASAQIRSAIEAQPFPLEMEDLIAECYRNLAVRCCVPALPVAVRSSATAEDTAGASFAGQQDTFLWIRGVDELLDRVRRCISSLYTARANAYPIQRGFAGAPRAGPPRARPRRGTVKAMSTDLPAERPPRLAETIWIVEDEPAAAALAAGEERQQGQQRDHDEDGDEQACVHG